MNKPDTQSLRAEYSPRYDMASTKILWLCDYIDLLPDEKVSVAEVREFAKEIANEYGHASVPRLLDFIDNGPPPKLTPEEIIGEHMGINKRGPWATGLVRKLRDAGYLPEESQ
jgi:hypothetical protein